METLAASITGKPFNQDQLTYRLENLWRAGNSANIYPIIEFCSSLKDDIRLLSQSKIRSNAYIRLKSLLQTLVLHREVNGQPVRRCGDVTYPVGEVSMARCSMLTVRGTGEDGLHCVAELPDGGVEVARTHTQTCGWTGHIRLPSYPGSTYLQLTLSVLVDSMDVLKGYGLYHPTLRHIPAYVPISRPYQLLISPK